MRSIKTTPGVKPLATGFRGSLALSDYKDAVSALGAIVVEWTRIEAYLAVMLATLMFGKSFSTGYEIIAIEVMEHCNTMQDKIACVMAAARLRLYNRQSLLKRFETKLNALPRSATVRNNLIHGRWLWDDKPGHLKHLRRISDAKETNYTPKSLAGILSDLEAKADDLHELFENLVVPASEKNLPSSL